MRSLILSGDVTGAAQVLSESDDVLSLGAGLTQGDIPGTFSISSRDPIFDLVEAEWQRRRGDVTDTETALREAILAGDVEAAARILRDWQDQFSLGAGLSFADDRRSAVRSDDRNRDVDVVAFKVMAWWLGNGMTGRLIRPLRRLRRIRMMKDC